MARIYADRKVEYDDMVASDPAMTALADPAAASMMSKRLWDLRESYEENYARLIGLYHGANRTADRTRVAAEIRRHIDSSRKVIEAIWSVERTRLFVDDVLEIVSEFDKSSQNILINRMQNRRGDLGALGLFIEQEIENKTKTKQSQLPPGA